MTANGALRFEDAAGDTCRRSGTPASPVAPALYNDAVPGSFDPVCRDRFQTVVEGFEAARDGSSQHG